MASTAADAARGSAEPVAAPSASAVALEGLFDDDNVEEARASAPRPSASPERDRTPEPADEEKAALEYYEDEEPAAPVVQEQTAWINVPQLPVRRTKETLLARLPNFVRYADDAFDAATWNELEDDAQHGDTAADTGDKDARSVLRTMSTVRWRWRDDKTPESNARIVRWSDGTESLQLGSEFFDVTRHAEPSAQGTPLTYLYVPHPHEGVLEAECPVRTSLTFKPSLQSDTHAKIASAIRHQRSARVVATSETFGALDPEKEKERIERQLKESEKRKNRERMRQLRASTEYDADLDLGVRRQGVRRKTGRSSYVTEWSDDDDDVPAMSARDYENEDDDGFIVHDEDDDEPQAEASEDEIERAERHIEAQERQRRGGSEDTMK